MTPESAQLDQMSELPRKLKPDAVREAIFEIRFTTDSVGEVIVGQLAGRLGKAVRLPMADIPLPVRRANPDMAYEATIMVEAGPGRQARIGEQVFIWSATASYPGWEALKVELREKVNLFLEIVSDARLSRLGFRYTNLLGREHGLETVSDLNLSISAAGQAVGPPLNLNYYRTRDKQTALIRVATREFVQGPVDPSTYNILIDLDVMQQSDLPSNSEIIDWTESAHAFLKDEFFRLLKPETIDALTEK